MEREETINSKAPEDKYFGNAGGFHDCKDCRDCECHVTPMKINCDLNVVIENKNKVIYVCPGKIQYFTACALCCADGEIIRIEYCGDNIRCICGENLIKGCLGYYKIVKSGVVFIPSQKLYQMHYDWFPTDILCFKAIDKSGKEVVFDVVFSYSKCSDNNCNRHCKCD